MHTILLNSAPLYRTSLGTIGEYKKLQGYRNFGMLKVAILSGFFKALLHVFHQLKQDTLNTHTHTHTCPDKHTHIQTCSACLAHFSALSMHLALDFIHTLPLIDVVACANDSGLSATLCCFQRQSLSNGTAMVACPAPCSMVRASVCPNWGSTSTTNDTTPLNERAHGKCASIPRIPNCRLSS